MKNAMMRIGLAVAVLGLLAGVAGPVWAGSVLVWSAGNSGGNTPGVASWLQASGQFTSVTGFNSDTTLTLSQLDQYDSVLFFTNSASGYDGTAIGNVLDQYAQQGHRLVLGTFSLQEPDIGGQLTSSGDDPLTYHSFDSYGSVTMASNDGSAFFAGVNSLSGYYHDDATLTAGATLRGSWSDGRALLATKGNVVAVDLFPDDSFFPTPGGDYRQLFVNSLIAPSGSEPPSTPEPSTLLSTGLAGLLGLGYAWRRRKAKAAV